MSLSKKQTKDVCLLNSNGQCRYLAEDDLDSNKWHCLKKSNKKAVIDTEVKEFFEKMSKSKKDPHAQGMPLNDNCKGYPILNYIEQGYDVD